jgi:hypothetical protein
MAGMPRIGWLYDGAPQLIAQPMVAMLHDDGTHLTLTLPWQAEVPTGAVERWFRGTGTYFADDIDRTRYSYEVPSKLLFTDINGNMALIGCHGRGSHRRSPARVPSTGQGSATVRLAVLNATNLSYDKVNGLRTEIPELSSWVDITSFTEQIHHTDTGRVGSLDVTLDSPNPVSLSRRLNLQLTPSWRKDQPTPGQHRLSDELFVELPRLLHARGKSTLSST